MTETTEMPVEQTAPKKLGKKAIALIVIGSILALCIICSIFGSLMPGTPKDEPAPIETTAVISEHQEAVEEEAPEAVEPEVPSDAEVLAAFNDFISERASSGVMLAKAVSNMTFENRVLHVTFDPAKAGVDKKAFQELNAFRANSAEFVGSLISSDDDIGIRLRPAIDAVETMFSDGSPAGTLTTADLYFIGTMQYLPNLTPAQKADVDAKMKELGYY